VYADFFAGETQEAVRELVGAGIKCAYTDYRQIAFADDLHIANSIARELNLQYAPYPPYTSSLQSKVWIPFLDDLITLSNDEKGLVIFVDGADVFLAENCRELFHLIEAFLIQVHHWMEKKKPCHLCFQMEPDDSLRQQFLVP
jgi:hypothetical protein